MPEDWITHYEDMEAPQFEVEAEELEDLSPTWWVEDREPGMDDLAGSS